MIREDPPADGWPGKGGERQFTLLYMYVKMEGKFPHTLHLHITLILNPKHTENVCLLQCVTTGERVISCLVKADVATLAKFV